MTTQTEALKLLVHEMEYVLSCINEDKIPFDGDDFHEALRLGKEALAQPEQEPVATLFGSLPVYDTPPQRTWVGLMRGVRVEGDTVVISTKNNDAARELCGELINEINK